ncbi:MAG: aminopeptidase P N-terminal domain-containing protein [Legionellaceae bacterium]|nr:aminopeptidase P N-terminal domain-containing protein [Legionellaceae bacterium]
MITQTEYRARRFDLANRLPSNAIAIIPGAGLTLRNGDAHYRFRQDSHFYYLTGFEEPQACLIIMNTPNPQSILFCMPKNPSEERWNGIRLGIDNARSILKMDDAYGIEQLSTLLPELLLNKEQIFYCFAHHHAYESILHEALRIAKKQHKAGKHIPQHFQNLEPILGDMRLFKSEAEINLMRQAASISVEAHLRAMQKASLAQFEYELEAELLYTFARHGCRAPAYDSIVAGGANACTLHYTANNQALTPHSLVLIDAAGEYQNYAADITRTFPLSGHFNDRQRAIYELVLTAQTAGIETVHPGTAWPEIQKNIVHILTTGLCDLGLLHGNINTLIETEAYKTFYMHGSGHWLGLDVHDAGSYRLNNGPQILQANMVCTVEPGIYIAPETPNIDPAWWGIGIRIEDDILVTPHGHENLSAALPKTIDEIEACVQHR